MADNNGFTQIENGGHFPNTHPVWGVDMLSQLPDLVARSYEQDSDSGVFNITPDDDTRLTTPASQLYIGQSGDVRIETEAGEVVTLYGLAEGVNYPFTFTIVRVFKTGTTADKIVGMF